MAIGRMARCLPLGVCVAVLTLVGTADAQQPASGAQATPPTVQQLFQAATDAFAAEDYEAALRNLTALEPRVRKNARSLAIVRLRMGLALVEMGRREEAIPQVEAGLRALPKDDPLLKEDWYSGEIALGRLKATGLDYAAAMDHYLRALEYAQGSAEQFRALLAMAEVGTFLDPQAALVNADRAEALLRAEEGKLLPAQKAEQRETITRLVMIRGRLLMNLGRFKEAEEALALAVKNLGGLTLRVDYSDLVTRSDASIAAMLAGHRDRARSYLVYTGAGRMAKQDFTLGADMDLPICGEDGVKPKDVAVVEFGIADNGAVSYARPIYASRQGDLALTFARAVAGWSWKPEDVKNIPVLFRLVTRLELRCSSAQGAPAVIGMADEAFDDWLAGLAQPGFDPPGNTQAAQRIALLAELERRRALSGPDAPALVPVLAQLMGNAITSPSEIADNGAALKLIMAGLHAPAMARLNVDYAITIAASSQKKRIGPPVVAEADYRDDAVALATLRLANYDANWRRGGRSIAPLNAVLADNRLPAGHVLKVGALVRRANLRAAAGDLPGAQRDYAETGLTEQQCSVVDAKPSVKSNPVSFADYPMEMVMLGVEGWTQVQFDIAADGKTLNQRAVISYPPFIFGDSGKKIVAGVRYEQSYRPAGGLGCGGSSHRIVFRRPGG